MKGRLQGYLHWSEVISANLSVCRTLSRINAQGPQQFRNCHAEVNVARCWTLRLVPRAGAQKHTQQRFLLTSSD